MSRTKFRIADSEDEYLHSTTVENLFINELLPGAPGDYVKLFLFGLMYAQSEQDMNAGLLARVLGMTAETVAEGWKYWERQGAVKIVFGDNGEDEIGIEYISQIERYYGRANIASPAVQQNNQNEQSEQDDKLASLIDEEIRFLIDDYEAVKGTTLSTTEVDKLTDLVKVYNVMPDVVSYAIKYCAEIEKYNIDYISKVALRWSEEGCKSISDVKEYLDKYSKRNAYYAQIFKTMGFNRLPNPADRDMMGRWFDELGFSLGEVLDACRLTAGQREPSLRYVNKVLENKALRAGGIAVQAAQTVGIQDRTTDTQRRETQGRNEARPVVRVSNKVLGEYYEYLRNRSERELDARKDEVCSRVVEMRELFTKENELNTAVLDLSFRGGNRQKRALLREKRHELEDEKKRLLVRNSYPEDYLERKYKCNICKDTGETSEGTVCGCKAARAKEAFEWIKKRS